MTIKRYFMPYFNADTGAEGGSDPEETTPPDETPKSFTQDELDRIVAERVARERKKTEKYSDYDALKTQLEELRQAEEDRKKSDMTATERLEAEKADALERATKAEQDRESALTTANQRLIKAEFRALARELNIRPDALDDAIKLADLSAVSVDDEGSINGVEDVVKALIENKPFLIDAPKQPKHIGDGPGGPGEQHDKTKSQLLAEAATKVRANPTPEALAKYMSLESELSS